MSRDTSNSSASEREGVLNESVSLIMMSEQTNTPPSLTREALYEQIWLEPVLILAARYGISNVGLAKICRKLSIPLPSRGYWQKLRAGHRVKRVALPTLKKTGHDPTSIVLSYRAPISIPETVIPEAVSAQQKREDAPDQRIRVASNLDADKPLHPLVKRTMRAFPSSKRSGAGIEVPTGEGVLDIRVSRATRDRAFRILNALLQALESRNYPVQSRLPRPVWRPYEGMAPITSWPGQFRQGMVTCVQVGDQDVLLVLREREKMAKRPPSPPPILPPEISSRRAIALEVLGRSPQVTRKTVDVVDSAEPTEPGQLILSIPHHVGRWGPVQTWKDGKRLLLEDVLNDVIVGIVSAAEEFRELVERWRREAEERHQAELLRIELNRRRAAEEAFAKELERQATSWSLAKTIREYINVVRTVHGPVERGATMQRLAIAPQGMSVDAWLAWAEAYVERLDPLTVKEASTTLDRSQL